MLLAPRSKEPRIIICTGAEEELLLLVLVSWPVLGRSEKIIIFSNLSGRPARHGSTSEKHYLCDQLPSATRGAGVDTDGPKFERRGLAVQIRGRRSPKPYLNGFQKLSTVKSRLTARPRRSNRAQAIAYLRFERRGLVVQIGRNGDRLSPG